MHVIAGPPNPTQPHVFRGASDRNVPSLLTVALMHVCTSTLQGLFYMSWES